MSTGGGILMSQGCYQYSEANDRLAAENRKIFDQAGLYVMNVMGREQKTSLLESTIKDLKEH
jgi:hypothetical protein